MDKDADKDLIEASRMGDSKAFEALVCRYQKPIFNVVYRMLNDREEARDVTQTVFLKSYENLHSFDPGRKFFSWICRIAVNETINVQSARRPEAEFDENRVADRSDPEDSARQSELHQGLEKALMAINPDYRSVVVLKHLMGFSYEDISQTLEIPEKTVKSRLFTARQNLRDILKEDAYL